MIWPKVLLLLAAEALAVVFLGSLSERGVTGGRGVKGRVAALSQSSLLINRFSYDGLGPEAFFLVGTTGSPGIEGTILSHPWDGRSYGYFDEDAPIIRNSFMEEDVVLHLPDSIRADEVAWVSVWCREFSVDFGSLLVPQGIDFSSLENRQQHVQPATSSGNAVSFGRLSENAHGVEGQVIATGPSTLLLSDFSYDGLGPAAFFLVGTSGTPEEDAESGTIISFPYDGQAYNYFDEDAPILRQSFNNEEVELTLPASITVDQVVWVSVWCRQFKVDFGSVQVPRGLDFSSLGETRIPVPEKPHVVEPSFVETNFVEPGFVEPSFVELGDVEPSFVEPSIVEASFVEPSVVETRRPVTSRPSWPGCYTFSTGNTKTIIPGTLDVSAATLVLPRFGSTLAITLPHPALMVEAYANNWVSLSKLMSADGLTWRLELEEQQELEIILVFSTLEGGASSSLARVTLEGGELADCKGQNQVKTAPESRRAPRRQAGHTQQAACVEPGMAVYGNNIAVQDNVDTPEACWEICLRLPACRFWNHNMYSASTAERTGKVGRCHIKNKRGKRKGILAGYTFGSSTCRPL
jgi:hypothetical protein